MATPVPQAEKLVEQAPPNTDRKKRSLLSSSSKSSGPVVRQDDLVALFGTESASLLKDNQNAMGYLQVRKSIQDRMDRDAESLRKEAEDDQALFEEIEEIKATFAAEGAGTGLRVTFGKLIGKIPILGPALRPKFDKAKFEHILRAKINLYKNYRGEFARRLGKQSSDGPTLASYIEDIRKERDQALAKLKQDITQMKEIKTTIFQAKQDLMTTTLKYISPDLLKDFASSNPEDLNVELLEQTAYSVAPDVKTDEGVAFREDFDAAIRHLRDVREQLVKVSSDINQTDSLLAFYRVEEASWTHMKEGAERVYEIINATVDNRERIVSAGIETAAVDTLTAAAIKLGEGLTRDSSVYMQYTVQKLAETVKASRVHTSKIVDEQKLKESEAILATLEKQKNVLQVKEYKEAEEVALKHVNEA